MPETSQRDQTISYMSLDLKKFESDKVTIFAPELLTETRPGHHLDPVVSMRYSDTNISALSHQKKYREVTKTIRKSNKVLISFVKPHRPILTSNLFRLCVSILQQTGVDITVLGLHSTRSAWTLHCQLNKKIKKINKAAGLPSAQTFSRFYRNP